VTLVQSLIQTARTSTDLQTSNSSDSFKRQITAIKMPSTTAILPSNDKQITTVTGSKSKECVVKSNNAAEERKKMQDWIKRFDQLFAALVKAENNQMKNNHDSQLEFSTTLQITGYKTSDVDLVVDTDRKLTVKGRREVTEDDDSYIEEFNEIIDLPDNVDDEEICLIKEENGYLTITAPILNDSENENSKENSGNDNLAVANPHDQDSKEWKQILNELFIPEIEPLV